MFSLIVINYCEYMCCDMDKQAVNTDLKLINLMCTSFYRFLVHFESDMSKK